MSRSQGRRKLAGWTAGIAFVWLVALPWLSALPGPRANIEWLRAQRIDPSARYYTEVEAMEPILERLNAELTGRSDAGRAAAGRSRPAP